MNAPTKAPMNASRRQFLFTSAAITGGFALGFTLPTNKAWAAAAADAPIFFLLEIFQEEGPVVCAAAAEDSLVLTRALLRGLSGAGSGYLRRMLQKDSERRT